jgi:peptidoglycan/xylan/chitin deacetylase (PgdA/CDA1 family)
MMKLFVTLAAACAALIPAALPAKGLEIAFTWDDLPVHGPLAPGDSRVAIGDRIIAATGAAGLPPPYGFVNGVREQQEPGSGAMLDHWRAAGFPLGNHGWSHLNLATHDATAYEADIARNEAGIAGRMANQDWHWFRYPFLSEGDTPEKAGAIRSYLGDHGYRIAGVTMSFGDYMWNEPYARCVAKGDRAAIAWLEASYLAAAAEDIYYSRTLFRTLEGRDIPYVLLMHVGSLDAVMLPRLIDLYRRQGFAFVSLEQAQRDSYYRGYMDPKAEAAPQPPEARMNAQGLPLPRRHAYGAELQAICR